MNPISVLIVDDEPGYADVLASCLSDTGWTIHTATSGEVALEILLWQPMDVLASDFLMPDGIDGAQLVNSALALQPNLYSIIFTGWNDRDFAVQSLRAGVSEFIDKTARLDEDLQRAIRRGIQTITLSRLGHRLLEAERESGIFDLLIDSLSGLMEFDGCCLAVLTQQETCRVERAVDLRTGKDYGTGQLDQPDSAYRYVIEQQAVYLPPLFAPPDRSLRPFFETSQSIAVVPLMLKGERGALGIEHQKPNRLGAEDVRFLNQIAQWICLAIENLIQRQERIRLEQEMSDDRRDRIARATLHEIKNPLNNLAAAVQLASNELSGDTRKSLLDNVTRINSALNRIIRPLIRGENTPREDIDIAETIQDAVSRFRLYHPPSSMSVLEQISPALPTIVGHRTLLVSAIVSLLDNGATAAAESEKAPELRVRADYAAGRDQVEILVTDNGGGIPEQHIDRIFDYAFTTHGDSGHSGYGLAFVKDVVELSGGHVSVDSAKDHGTTFKLSFPAGNLNSHTEAPVAPERR
ncbi:MAG: ATP-binding protein [Thermoanaerobaculia bacterium]